MTDTKKLKRKKEAAVEATCSGEQLAAAVRQALHRGAVLEQLAHEVVEMFVMSGEGGAPRYVIGGFGVHEVADADVVLGLAAQLRQLARLAQDEARVMLDATVLGVQPPPEQGRMYLRPGFAREAVANSTGLEQVFDQVVEDEEEAAAEV